MARTAIMRPSLRQDPQVARMVGVSAALHATVLFVLIVLLPLVKPRPLPIVAYTVELTDSSSLGGRLAPGRTDLPMGARPGPTASAEAPAKQGEPAPKPEPMAKAEPPPPEPPKPLERAKAPEPPKPTEPAVKLPSLEKPPPAPKPPEAKPQPKPEPKPEPPKVEAKKPEPKPEAKTAERLKPAEPVAKPAPAEKAAESKPSAEAKPVGKPGGKPEGAAEGGTDAYAAAADKWRTKGATGGGGGLAGTDTGSGPIGTGYGGGGGQVVGFEFLAYQQRVVTTVKGVWTNAAPRPGLVAKVRFQIAPNGEVSGVRIEEASGDGVFDSSALRAVQRANPLPPPPARYVNEFREFMIEFHSEEGGQASG